MKFKGFKMNSIRTKLIISLVGICVIPLIITGFGSYNQSKSILSKKLTVTSSQTLTEINNGLVDYFNGFSNMILMVSSNYDFVNVDTGNNAKYIPDILKGVKESNKDILCISYGTASGKFDTYPNDKMPKGYDATTRPWYKQALEHKGQVIITPAYKDNGTGNNVVTLARTVEKSGQVVGVVAIDLPLTTLAQRISTKKVGSTGYVFISDVSGNILAHPQKELINTNAASKLSFWNKAKSENSGFVNYKDNGTKKFGVYQTNELTGWKLVATLDESELSSDTKSILQTTFLMILVMGIISVFMSLLLSKGISNNILKLKEVFAKASNGDLTVSINASTKDEFNDLAISFNLMIKNISDLMHSVTSSSKTVLLTSTSLTNMSEGVTASISEVASAIEEVSIGATHQAQNAQNGASQIEDLSNRIDKISVNSNEMDKISSNTKDLGSKGLLMVNTLIEKSNKTKIATAEVNNIVQDMNESTKQINAISETIANITEQTNLLSLNASIESARAGEAGRGFAVVADEIRKLADQSKTSTEEIKTIIASIQKKSDVAVNAIKSTETVVNEQDLAVVKTQEIFSEILKSIEVMITKVDEVKISIIDINEKKQSTVLEIENISAISEQTAASSEQVTASTEEITATMEEFTKHSGELQMLAEQLGAEINKFKIN
ncbi:methyl-accepting chemotaxis protein [Clostridium tagluense]|uniref:methyl-accepting chemotaxis protein n=1 Tax=Clostridium tagluense TaxID=360422 RepID=UPI001C0ABBA6|nr:methyl-accepting chemotaxis protein [Clostridium tagluense]MBU3127102.1 methyl-accepting chemotaxis protein [Clostridium tagluense]MCB2311103.1 methyl-accepting chemotaxis protein [Clostridium tagluense]MCB2318380.1 methyl-accepting chemotaxis protein [Clostridium tagluense]MCB2323146.1 methyl-accepting chemotaxis protein [Clostridium tagluense]MCB2325571.1 methyl-accepting chemotaxis protein [Clostridium tagluense]